MCITHDDGFFYLDMVTVLDKQFIPYISASAIQRRIQEIAVRIDEDYREEPPVLLGILSGSFMFLSDLAKHVRIPVWISFVKVSSYEGLSSTGKVEELLGVGPEVEGKNVVIVEDIVDTGISVSHVKRMVLQKKPKSLAIASMLQKPDALLEKDVHVDYLGFSIKNKFVVGYGLDYNGYGRNLPEIYELIE